MEITKIRETVRSLIDKIGIEDPSIPVEKIANFFSLNVVFYPNFPDSISGTIIKDNELLAIGVNSNHPKVRQRFTIAHELGHFVLGHDENSILDDTFDKETDKEKEANRFAGELLMPKYMLEKDLKEKEYTISSLARRYEVSEQALSIKLLQDNLIGNKNLKKPL